MVSLRRSTRVATGAEEIKEEGSEKRVRAKVSVKWPQHAVELKAADAEKLGAVLESVAPHLLDTKSPSLARGTLRDALKNGTSLQALAQHATHLTNAEHGPNVRLDASAHASLLLLQHFLIELAGEYEENPSRPVNETNTYALHMRLPMGEYFTNAVRLDEAKAQALDAGHADVVAIAPPIGRAPPPTFGERIPRGTRLKNKIPQTELRPTSFLSYGPYCSSFGPAYDSAGAALDVRSTEEVWQRQKQRRTSLSRRWGAPLAARAEAAFTAPPKDEALPKVASDTLAADAAALDPALDAELLAAGVAHLDADEELAANAELLHELQELQWLRVRMDYAQPTQHAAVGAEEQAVASELLASLVRLLLRVPPRAVAEARTAPLLSRSVAVLAHSLQGTGAFQQGYWGTLPDATFGVQSRAYLNTAAANGQQQTTWGALVRPRVVADNATVRWEQGSAPGALAAAAVSLAAAPGETVQRAFAAPSYARPPQVGAYSLGAYAANHQPYPRPV